MADMTIHQMLDAISLPALEAHAPAAFALAGYVNGRWPTYPELAAKYGRTGKFLLSIDVAGNANPGAQCLDVETGDATVASAPGWARKAQAAGKAARDFRWFPKLYASISVGAALVSTMTAAGIARNEWMYWSAHYTPNYPHICGPGTCRQGPQADATQWTDSYAGAQLDSSLCFGYFFSGAPAAPQPGPFRHVADGAQTLGQIAAGRATTAGHLLSLSAKEYTAADETALSALKLPAGTPYYTSNPG